METQEQKDERMSRELFPDIPKPAAIARQQEREASLWDLIHAGNCRTLALVDLVARIEATSSLDDVLAWPEFAAAKKALDLPQVKAV